MHSTPNVIFAYFKSYELIKEQEDINNWNLGQYVAEAIMCTIGNQLSGSSSKKHKYPKQPRYLECKEKEKNIKKQRELFVASLQAMQTNFELSKKSGE